MDGAAAIEDALRRAHIDAYDVIGEPAPRDLQALADIAAQVCDVRYAAINLVTEDEQHQLAASGVDPSVCTRADSMCAAVLAEPATVVVHDARADLRFRDNPFVSGVIDRIRFYASAPLETPDGVTIGRLCVFDTEPRLIDGSQEEALEQLGRRIVDLLELRLRTRQLEDSLAALSRSRDELARSNELLDRFAGQVSHDLLNPLTAVITGTEMLAREPVVADDPGLQRIALNASTAARRMCDMVEDVLRYSRLGAALVLDEVDLDTLADAVLIDLGTVLTETGAQVEVGPLGTVHADGRQLYVVLLNLVSNALKFTREGVAPQVRVTREDGVSVTRLLVTDDGPGVPEDDRERVFRLFTRGRGQEVAGEGIGLATVRRVVEAHGGRVHLEGREDGPGTVAVVELPKDA